MVQVVIFAGLTLVSLVAGISALILGALVLKNRIKKTPNGRFTVRLKKAAAVFGLLLAVNAGFVFYTQYAAATPPIRDVRGNIMEGGTSFHA